MPTRLALLYSTHSQFELSFVISGNEEQQISRNEVSIAKPLAGDFREIRYSSLPETTKYQKS